MAVFLLAHVDERRFFTLDAGGYVALGRDLHAGYLDSGSDLFATGLLRTPGYPLFVAAVLVAFGSVSAVVMVQILVSLATIVLTWHLGRRLLGEAPAATGALVLALDPVSALYTVQLQPEALFSLLVVAGVLCWVTSVTNASTGLAALAGALIGLAALTRPIGLYLPAVFLAWGVCSRVRLPMAAAFVVPCFVLIGGWIARNASVTGVPLLSTIEGQNLLEYRASGALARGQGISMEEARERLRERLRPSLAPGDNPADTSRAQTRLAIRVMAENRWGTVETVLDGAVRLLAGNGLTALARISGDDEPEAVDTPVKRLAAAVLGLWLALVYAGVAWALFTRGHDGRHVTALLVGCAAYFILVSAGPEANTRFRVPALPFLALLAGAGWSRALGKRPVPSSASPS